MRAIPLLQVLCCLIYILSMASCDSQGHGGVSDDINESKRRNIFIAEYTADPNPYLINDTLKIKVLNAWVENQWNYGKSEDETIMIKDKYQLIIEVETGALQTYGLEWTIGIDGSRYIRSCGRNCLMSDFNQMPQDIEEWKVQNGWKLDSVSKKKIIGSFRMLRKNSQRHLH